MFKPAGTSSRFKDKESCDRSKQKCEVIKDVIVEKGEPRLIFKSFSNNDFLGPDKEKMTGGDLSKSLDLECGPKPNAITSKVIEDNPKENTGLEKEHNIAKIRSPRNQGPCPRMLEISVKVAKENINMFPGKETTKSANPKSKIRTKKK